MAFAADCELEFPVQQTKELIAQQIEQERAYDKNADIWQQVKPTVAPPKQPRACSSRGSRGFVAVIGKLDLSNAYYQYPVQFPEQNVFAMSEGVAQDPSD